MTTATVKDNLTACGIIRRGHTFYCEGKKITKDEARKIISNRPAEITTEVKTAPVIIEEASKFTFNKLNAVTQALFFQLCEQIMEATKDASLVIAAEIGKQVPSIGLQNAPRLSNLKKAGVIERVGNKGGWLQVTDLGRHIFHDQ